MKEKIR